MQICKTQCCKKYKPKIYFHYINTNSNIIFTEQLISSSLKITQRENQLT